jgi:hypothetical protein
VIKADDMPKGSPVKFNFVDPMSMSFEATRQRAIVIARHLAMHIGRKTDGRKADELVTKMATRQTVRWADLVRLDQLIPPSILGAATVCGVDRDVLKRACDCGGIETAPFIDVFGAQLEQVFVGMVGRDEAKRRILADFHAAYARVQAMPNAIRHPIIEQAMQIALTLGEVGGHA